MDARQSQNYKLKKKLPNIQIKKKKLKHDTPSEVGW